MPTGTQDKAFAELMKDQIDEVKISHSALDEAIDWVSRNLSPEDVFSAKELEAWAENNGFTKE